MNFPRAIPVLTPAREPVPPKYDFFAIIASRYDAQKKNCGNVGTLKKDSSPSS